MEVSLNGAEEGLPAGSASTATAEPQAYRRFFEAALSLLAIVDREGCIELVNPAWERVLGYCEDELVGRSFFDFVHPEDRESTRARAVAVREGRTADGWEIRHVRRDGEVVWLRWTSVSADEEERLFAVGTDVSAEKRTEEHLRRGEELAQLGTFELDLTTGQNVASPGLLELFGAGPEEGVVVLDPSLPRIHPDDRESVRKRIQEFAAGERRWMREVDRVLGADGGFRYIETIAELEVDGEGRPARVVGVCQDMTDRVEAERREEEARAMERASFVDAPLGMSVVDLDPESRGKLLRLNAALAGLVGRDEDELLEMSLRDLVPQEDWAATDASLEALARGDVDAFSHEKRYLGPDGEAVWVRVHGTALTVPGRSAPVALEQVEDIGDRKRAEQELRESRELLQRIIDAAPATIFVKDLEGRYLMVNRVLAAAQGFEPSHMVGRRDRDLFPPSTVERWRRWEREALESDEPVAAEERIPLEDGDHLFLTHLFAMRDEHGRPYAVVGTGTDITDRLRAEEERRKLEASLQQSQRLETVGRLAGGVAHDFNNLLSVILNYTSLAADALPPESDSAADLGQVARAAERAAELTHDLVVFSRQELVAPRVLDPNDVVRGAERILRRTIGEDVELRLELDERTPPVEMDPGQLERVLMNLVVNARAAMPEGGVLTIATGLAEVRDEAAEGPARCARLRVLDTGAGMTREVASRAFEPFFTTKARGEGTGLGLATLHGIVAQAGGRVSLDSAPDAGTEVVIDLPATDRTPEPDAPPLRIDDGRGAGRRILVVEDEDAVRRLVARILDEAGYKVVEAEDPEQALAELERSSTAFDLVLTDVVTPRMSGVELRDRLRESHPGLRVLFMSGYTEEIVGSHGLEDEEEAPLLPKPFTRDSLLAAVAEVVRSR